MSTPHQSGEAQRGFQKADNLLEAAQELGSGIRKYAELLADDSVAVLKAIKSPVVGTHGEFEPLIEWPLTETFLVQGVLLQKAGRNLGIPPAKEDKNVTPDNEALLSTCEYLYQGLTLVYGDGITQHAAQAQDLIGWTEGMTQRGWPILAHYHLHEPSGDRLAVSVYKETDEVTAFLGKSEVIETGEYEKSCRWISPRVLMTDYTDELDRVTELMKTA